MLLHLQTINKSDNKKEKAQASRANPSKACFYRLKQVPENGFLMTCILVLSGCASFLLNFPLLHPKLTLSSKSIRDQRVNT